MESELLCPVCHQCFKEPVTLRCKHHICSEHVTNLAKDHGKLSCPVCNTLTFQVESGLPLNHNLQVVVDRWQELQTRSASRVREACGICEEALATLQCVQCDGALCEACASSTHSKGFFKNHTVVAISDTDNQHLDVYCSLHAEEKVGFYCTDCSMPVCSHCILMGDHQDHATIPIAKAAEEQRQMLISQAERLRQRRKASQSLTQELRILEAKVHLGGQQQRDSIENEMARLRELLEARHKQLLMKSTIEEEAKLSQIRAQLGKTQGTLEHVESLLRRSEDILRVDSEFDFVTVVLPLIQDGTRCSSQGVEAIAQVSTYFKPVSVDAQIRSMNDLDLGLQAAGLSQASGLPRVVTTAASSLHSSAGTSAGLSGVSTASSLHHQQGGNQGTLPPAQVIFRSMPSGVPIRQNVSSPRKSRDTREPSQAQVVRTVFMAPTAENETRS